MANFDSMGSGLARGLTAGLQIGQRSKEFEAQKQAQQSEVLRANLENARVRTDEFADALIEQAGAAAEAGATPEQLAEFEKAVQAGGAGFDTTLQNIVATATADGATPEQIEQIKQTFGTPGQFTQRKMTLLEQSIQTGMLMAKKDQVETIAPEDLPEGFPKNAVVQKHSDGKLDVVFDPTDSSATQEKYDMLIASGLPPALAAGIAGGRYKLIYDPITRVATVGDLAKQGEVIDEVELPETPPVVPPGTDVGTAVGFQGIFANVVNVLGDAFGAGLAFPESQEATDALNTVQQQTKLLLQSVVPGRPAVDIREGLAKLTVTPNSIFTGEQRAKSRLEQTQRLMDNEIARMEGVLQLDISPTDRALTEQNLGPLKEMSRTYTDMLKAFESGNGFVKQGKSAAREALNAGDKVRAKKLIDAIKRGDQKAIEELLKDDAAPGLELPVPE